MRVEVQARVTGAPPASRVQSVLRRAARAAGSPAREVSVLFCADSFDSMYQTLRSFLIDW